MVACFIVFFYISVLFHDELVVGVNFLDDYFVLVHPTRVVLTYVTDGRQNKVGKFVVQKLVDEVLFVVVMRADHHPQDLLLDGHWTLLNQILQVKRLGLGFTKFSKSSGYLLRQEGDGGHVHLGECAHEDLLALVGVPKVVEVFNQLRVEAAD